MSPLPTNPKQLWPPSSVPTLDYAVWDEWYSGRFARPGSGLSSAPITTGSFPERLTGGYVHRHANLRDSSATPGRPGSQSVHCPLAADIAQVSADLVFGDMPSIAVANKPSQTRLDKLLDAMGIQNKLLEAAEPCAALGGAYLRVAWDTAVADYPFISHVDADQAVPEFRYGFLAAVTFWREVAGDTQKGVVLRHLERYEEGKILHGLYRGDKSTLGYEIPLAGSPDTERLQLLVTLPAGLPHKMAAFYVPNVRPVQHNRKSALGRADISGAESDLDALDEVWSSLMRDFRLGQAHILTPSGTLSSNDPSSPRGAGKSLDLDREIFTEIDVPPEGMQPTVMQPDLRVESHVAAALALTREIVSKAGYSPQTYGIDVQGQAESGTALRIREEKTYRTLARKRRYWETGLADGTEALLVIDRAKFGGKGKAMRPTITWPEEAMGAGEMASTVQTLYSAEAASIKQRVKLVNPDWNDAKIEAEVLLIQKETGALVPPPEF